MIDFTKETQLVRDCIYCDMDSVVKKDKLEFNDLFSLKYPLCGHDNYKFQNLWAKFKITATTNQDFAISKWNGKMPVDRNTTERIIPAGSRVMILMVSRFEDVGITDNLDNPTSFDCRVAVEDLCDFEFLKKESIKELYYEE